MPVEEISYSSVKKIGCLPASWFLVIKRNNEILVSCLFWNFVRAIVIVDIIAELNTSVNIELTIATIVFLMVGSIEGRLRKKVSYELKASTREITRLKEMDIRS